MGGCHIQEWLTTFKLVPRPEGDDNNAPSKTAIDDYNAYYQPPQSDDSSSPSVLVGADDDLLIPAQRDIEQLYYRAAATWRAFVREADDLHHGTFPSVLGNPYILLGHVPCLPAKVPNVTNLYGQPVWHVPDAETPTHDTHDAAPLDFQNPYGVLKILRLRVAKPLACRTTTQQDFSSALTAPASGLLILTLCWSHILSARLLEMQGQTMQYHTSRMLVPDMASGQRDHENFAVVRLVGDDVPSDLVHWLCGLLAPELAWGPADGRGVPPWAAYCAGDARFIIEADSSGANKNTEKRLPECREGCRAFDCLLPPVQSRINTARFHWTPDGRLRGCSDTALCVDQQPLPTVCCSRAPAESDTSGSGHGRLAAQLRSYVADLPYVMTLSLDEYDIGSLLWSVFWQPDVSCNLVSVWFGAIMAVLGPIMDAGNLMRLVQVFALRRPRPAMWWLGLFLLGDTRVLGWIPRYMDELFERQGFGTFNTPDVTVAVWTQTPHSYLDDVAPRPYPDPETPVALIDLLRHRHNFRLQETVYLAWRPFGRVRREQIEPELWPWLEQGFSRTYVTWIWWMRYKTAIHRSPQSGFMASTHRIVLDVPERLDLAVVDEADEKTPLPMIKLYPSLAMTYWMLNRSKEQVAGDADAIIFDVRGHKWSRGY